jgi:hypothetical protein
MVFPWMDEGDLKGYLLEKRKKASLNQRLDIVSGEPHEFYNYPKELSIFLLPRSFLP